MSFFNKNENIKIAVPMFRGTFDDFYTFINDYVKNKVPYLTRRHKPECCELCGEKKTLEAAHVRDRDRRVLMQEAFDEIAIPEENGIFAVDLNKYADKIGQIHSDPHNFHFLCRDCHKKYDAANSTIQETDFSPRNNPSLTEFSIKKGKNMTTTIKTNHWPFKRNKTGAVACCKAKGINIEGQICFASVKANLFRGNEVYWADNDHKEFLDRDWVFILNNQHKKCFHVINIPAGKLNPDLRKANWNKDLFDWNITTSSYIDVDSQFNLARFGVQDVAYTDIDIAMFDR